MNLELSSSIKGMMNNFQHQKPVQGVKFLAENLVLDGLSDSDRSISWCRESHCFSTCL